MAGLERTAGGAVLASSVKRALLRKDPTFSEADYGFRAFGELMRHLAERNVVELARARPRATRRSRFRRGAARRTPSSCCASPSATCRRAAGRPHCRVSRTRCARSQPDFSEKKFGYRGFLQFCKAAETQGLIKLDWDDEAGDYLVQAVEA